MKHFALYFGIAGAMVMSCSVREEIVEAPQQENVIYYASFEQPVGEGTRVYANEDLLLRWTADDRVSIFGKNTYNQQYRFLGDTGDNSGGFSKVDVAEYVTGNAIPDVVSVYPYQATTKISENEVISVNLPARQTYAGNTFGLGANTMVSVSSDNFLQYKNVGGYLVLKLYGEEVSVSSITLKGNKGEKLAGKASVTMPSGEVPSVEMTDEATTEITLTCATPVRLGATEESGTRFWFVVPPVTFEEGFTVRVLDSKGTAYEKATSKTVSVGRNNLSQMEPFDITSCIVAYEYQAPITIDGQFDDWDGMDESRMSVATSVPGARNTALELVKVYADEQFVYVYFEWDKEQISHSQNEEHVPFDIFLNSDGDSSTGGFTDLFSDACTDVLLEGFIYPGGISIGSYEPNLYKWVGKANGSGWMWTELENRDLCDGAGIEGKYELSIQRDLFPLGTIADNFSIGFAILQSWSTVGLLPNAAITSSNPSGRAPSLPVSTYNSQDTFSAPICIEGKFDDWDKLDESSISVATCDPGASKTALELVKVYADEQYVYVYFEWDKEQICHDPDSEHVPFEIFLNSDGDSSTGGYADEFSDACTDVLLEGFIYPGGISIGSYEPTLLKWDGEANGSGWMWTELENRDLCAGAGIEGKYELSIRRDLFPLGRIADNFSVGFVILQNWTTVGLLPNAAITSSNPSGRAPSLSVSTTH